MDQAKARDAYQQDVAYQQESKLTRKSAIWVLDEPAHRRKKEPEKPNPMARAVVREREDGVGDENKKKEKKSGWSLF